MIANDESSNRLSLIVEGAAFAYLQALIQFQLRFCRQSFWTGSHQFNATVSKVNCVYDYIRYNSRQECVVLLVTLRRTAF